jgi:thiosulfate/3-mercaptopyruvate sulfurtransferase
MLITADELRHRLRSDDAPAVLDVRWRLDRPDGRDEYRSGHIPGAVYVSLDDELSDHRVAGRGRHPLPSGATVQDAMRRWGIREGQAVVAYDDWNRAGSSRAWWVLSAAGVPDVMILDGGLHAWEAAGGELHTGEVNPPSGDAHVSHDDLYRAAMPTLTADEVAAGAVGTLLDARAPERYRGEIEPVDAVAGHIPGARNLPGTALLRDDGSFADVTEILALANIADSPVGVYCGSGVTATVLLAALTSAGIDAALFPGSWSQWCVEPGRMVARGPA